VTLVNSSMGLMRKRISHGRRTALPREDQGPALPWTSPSAVQDQDQDTGTEERSTQAARRSGCDLASTPRV